MSNQHQNDQQPILHITSNTFHQRKCCKYLGGPIANFTVLDIYFLNFKPWKHYSNHKYNCQMASAK